MSDTAHRSRRKPPPPAPPAAPVGVGALREVDLGPLTDRLGYVMRRAQIAVFQDFFASFAALDISPAQYSALTVIEANPGLSQTQVADALGIKKSNFVAMIGTLERRGLVTRDAAPGDRRTYRLFLSPAGRALIGRLHGIAEAHDGRIRDLIGSDAFEALFPPLRAIAEALRRAPGDTDDPADPEASSP